MKPEWTKTLTPDNFNDWIKGEVDAGRTAFVRWIASEGWCAPPIRCPSRRLFANRPEACAGSLAGAAGGARAALLPAALAAAHGCSARAEADDASRPRPGMLSRRSTPATLPCRSATCCSPNPKSAPALTAATSRPARGAGRRSATSTRPRATTATPTTRRPTRPCATSSATRR